jgi:ribosome-associated translation inhibitor RaiA
MKLPLEIRTRHASLTAPLEEEIRERAAKLDQFYERVMRCRVTLEGPGPHHRKGIHYVRIDLTVPGSEIAVTRQAGNNLEEALREAFSAAGRRLEDYVRRVRRYVKTHQEQPTAGW